MAGAIAGCDAWTEIEAFGNERLVWFRKFLALPHGIPSHDTFARVFAMLDTGRFAAGLLAWSQALATAAPGRLVALDGKTLRHRFDAATGGRRRTMSVEAPPRRGSATVVRGGGACRVEREHGEREQLHAVPSEEGKRAAARPKKAGAPSMLCRQTRGARLSRCSLPSRNAASIFCGAARSAGRIGAGGAARTSSLAGGRFRAGATTAAALCQALVAPPHDRHRQRTLRRLRDHLAAWHVYQAGAAPLGAPVRDELEARILAHSDDGTIRAASMPAEPPTCPDAACPRRPWAWRKLRTY